MSTNAKRAYQAQLREQKITFYTRKIKELIGKVNNNLFSVDYLAELEKMLKESPKDKGLILQAERDAYRELKGRIW